MLLTTPWYVMLKQSGLTLEAVSSCCCLGTALFTRVECFAFICANVSSCRLRVVRWRWDSVSSQSDRWLERSIKKSWKWKWLIRMTRSFTNYQSLENTQENKKPHMLIIMMSLYSDGWFVSKSATQPKPCVFSIHLSLSATSDCSAELIFVTECVSGVHRQHCYHPWYDVVAGRDSNPQATGRVANAKPLDRRTKYILLPTILPWTFHCVHSVLVNLWRWLLVVLTFLERWSVLRNNHGATMINDNNPS